MEGIVAMDAVFDQRWVSRLEGARVKSETNKWDQAMALIADIENFRFDNDCDRLVVVWCGSTEAFQEPSEVHDTVEAFEAGLKANDDNISPSQIYVYAALQSGVPFANGAPNLSTDLPCMIELGETRGVPFVGKDFKTGQTLMKTLIAPGLKARMLGLRGWYSTNILGNRDGEVLDAPESFKTKEESKLGVLRTILQPETYPELYGNVDHVVRINYYPPRGDNKEGWDAIDIFGWMGYPMQIKIDFLCRDSILAAPIVLDLALFMDLAHRLLRGLPRNRETGHGRGRGNPPRTSTSPPSSSLADLGQSFEVSRSTGELVSLLVVERKAHLHGDLPMRYCAISNIAPGLQHLKPAKVVE